MQQNKTEINLFGPVYPVTSSGFIIRNTEKHLKKVNVNSAIPYWDPHTKTTTKRWFRRLASQFSELVNRLQSLC